MGALFSLLGGFKGVAMLVIIVALGGWLWNQKNNLDQAIAQRDTAIAQRDLVAGERDKAIAAARTNAQTIAALNQEKELINQVLNKLAQDRQGNKELADAREAVIQEQGKDPANQTPVAPVLSDIISQIQKDRANRRQ